MKVNREKLDSLKSALLINADSIIELNKMEENIFGSCVIDPPYGINFLGKEWDKFTSDKINNVPTNYSVPMPLEAPSPKLVESKCYQEWCYCWAKEVLRVIKPGGHLLSFCSTRMYHRLVTALENAGWEIRDTLAWMYGTGFPKSTNVALGVDKLMGCSNRGHRIEYRNKQTGKVRCDGDTPPKYQARTSEAKGWEGFEIALKPAMELICLARKPLSEKSIATNVLKWGTGGLNIDGCRIKDTSDNSNRWPANVIMDKEAGKILDFQHKTLPSRFFYCPKPNNAEKNAGLEDMPKVRRDVIKGKEKNVMSKKSVLPQQNSHPTIKPVTLLRYLCRLVTPPNGVVLDCFMGSGSCGIAAYEEGFKYVGIEMQKEYFEIAKKRIQHAVTIKKAG